MADRREFLCQEGGSDKFWVVEVDGSAVVTSYGRRGAQPRTTRTECATPNAAQHEADRLIREKLRKGYVEGAIEGTTPPPKIDWRSLTMSEEVFWQVIALLDWRKGEDSEAVLLPAVRALTKMGAEAAMRFQDLLAEKLHALDTERHARHIGEYSYGIEGGHFSVDWFLYVRCRAVALGHEAYRAALADPERMPVDEEFEDLLYLAAEAYESATGEEWDYDPPTDFETFANAEGWRPEGLSPSAR